MSKGVTRETIVDAAFAVLDDEGIDGLTVRAVADRLDVKAPALYWHVRDKKELLDEMGTRVWRDIATENDFTEGENWRDALTRYGRVTRTALLGHRDGARTFSGTFLTDDGVLQRQETYLEWMERQGFDVDAATDAFALVTAFVVGHCIEEQERSQAADDRYSTERRDARIDVETHPRVAASGRRMLAFDPGEWFEALLTVVLDGVAALRHTPPSRRIRPDSSDAASRGAAGSTPR